MAEAQATTKPRDVRNSSGFVVSGLSAGHGVFHWCLQGFQVMLPEVQDTFRLSEVGVGAISTTREMASGLVTLPGGILVDLLRRHWGLVLAASMGGFGLGWLIMGLSPVYPVLLVGIVLVAGSASTWHLPAMAALSHRYPERRGTVLSIHGIGGSIGDVIAPPLTGLLLVVLSWREIISIYAIGPLLLVFAVIWAFRGIGRMPAEPETLPSPTLKAQLTQARPVFRNRVLWGIAFVEGLRGMAFIPFITFLPLYLDNDVGMSVLGRSLHMGLLVAVGVAATPVAGYLSDRFGRKVILVPGVVALCVLTFLLVPFGTGVPMTLILAAMGFFLYADQPILTAAALDIVGRQVATTTLGMLSFSRFAMSAFSPLIAGALYHSVGIEATFYYVGGLYVLAAAMLLVLPLGRRSAVS
jgi:MFS family permease